MNPVMFPRRHALSLLAAATCLPVFAGSAILPSALPGDSLYRLSPRLTDQEGRPFDLVSLRGGPVLVSMFYSSCEMVCPVLFETIAQTIKALPPATQEHVRILLVTFDPDRDTVAVLKDTAGRHGCDKRWTLARSSSADARQIAAALGVQYRRLPNGEYNHSTSILLLNAQGQIVKRSGSLGAVDPELVAALKQSA
jgi:protein SCO1/2